jgi:hypothetical protein
MNRFLVRFDWQFNREFNREVLNQDSVLFKYLPSIIALIYEFPASYISSSLKLVPETIRIVLAILRDPSKLTNPFFVTLSDAIFASCYSLVTSYDHIAAIFRLPMELVLEYFRSRSAGFDSASTNPLSVQFILQTFEISRNLDAQLLSDWRTAIIEGSLQLLDFFACHKAVFWKIGEAVMEAFAQICDTTEDFRLSDHPRAGRIVFLILRWLDAAGFTPLDLGECNSIRKEEHKHLRTSFIDNSPQFDVFEGDGINGFLRGIKTIGLDEMANDKPEIQRLLLSCMRILDMRDRKSTRLNSSHS